MLSPFHRPLSEGPCNPFSSGSESHPLPPRRMFRSSSQSTSSTMQNGRPPPISWLPRTPFGPCRAVMLGIVFTSSLGTIFVFIPHTTPPYPGPCSRSPSRGRRDLPLGRTSAACASMPNTPPYGLRKGLHYRHPALVLRGIRLGAVQGVAHIFPMASRIRIQTLHRVA